MRIILGVLLTTLFLCSCSPDLVKPETPQKSTTTAENHETVSTETIGQQEQEACTPHLKGNRFVQSDCDEGLVCAPNFDDVTVGTCRVDCLTTKGTKALNACPAGRTCQVAISANLETMGAFCLARQNTRDGQCLAMADTEACGNNRKCLPSEVAKTAEGEMVARDFICRDTCPYGAPDADKKCNDGEGCEPSPYEQGGGLCVARMSWARDADFASSKFTGEVCNEISDHKFCDESLLKGLEKPAQVACIHMSRSSDRGFCVAVCSTPAIGTAKGGQLTCPTGFNCSLDFSRKRGLAKQLKKTCDPTKCEENKPCPEQCGVGDGECTKEGVCIAPFGTCQPH